MYTMANGLIELKYVNTKQQTVDGFTKHLAYPSLKIMKQQIGIRRLGRSVGIVVSHDDS